MNCVYIYHLESGTTDLSKYLKLIKITLESKYQEVIMLQTHSKEETIEKVYEYSKTHEIIFSGGDGTFNDVLNGIMKSGAKATIGYIPTGTAHDMARNIGLSTNPTRSLNVILNGHTSTHDVIKINDDYAIYGVALGKFTNVSYTTKRKYKKRLGRLSYLFSCLGEVFKNKNNIINIDGNIYYTPLIVVMNSKYLGSFKVNKIGYRNDGTVDVIVLKNDSFLGNINILRLFLFGKTKTNACYKDTSIQLRTMKIKEWCIDGEKYLADKLTIEVISRAFKIYTP